LAGLPIKQHPTPEHRAYAISLKFHSCEQIHQADCLTPSLRNQVASPLKACGAESSLDISKQSSLTGWITRLPNPVYYPAFRASESILHRKMPSPVDIPVTF